ncbi:Uncharacterised protein [uncultured archaeon]|nr:Uncharacterised protein [uncultured archaeon]
MNCYDVIPFQGGVQERSTEYSIHTGAVQSLQTGIRLCYIYRNIGIYRSIICVKYCNINRNNLADRINCLTYTGVDVIIDIERGRVASGYCAVSHINVGCVRPGRKTAKGFIV